MKPLKLMHTTLFATLLSLPLAPLSAAAEDCPFSGPTTNIKNLPGYKALSTIDPVKVLDQLTISESKMILEAVQKSLDIEDPGLDAVKAWAIFTDVPRFYNGGQIEYFALDKDRFALVNFFPDDKALGHVAKLATASTSARDYRKAKYEVLADVREGSMSCR